MLAPSSLLKLIESLKKLPGIGERSAERIVFHLIREGELIEELISSLSDAKEKLTFCSICHSITEEDPCPICRDETRDKKTICVVEAPQDVVLFEKLSIYRGKYHVLGGVISPIRGIGPEDLFIEDLVERVREEGVQEVIIALPPSVEGDTTAHYLKEKLKPLGVKVTRIARGLPTGTDLSLSDELTLKEALKGRREF